MVDVLGGGWMSVPTAPEHRRRAGRGVDPRLLLLAAFLLGALLSAGVVGAFAVTWGDGSSEGTKATGRSGRGSATPSSQPAPPSGKAEQWALMTQPLAQLQRGDRVVYNMNACRFRSWVGEGRDVALIACPGEEPFQSRTEYLVPVEPAQGD